MAVPATGRVKLSGDGSLTSANLAISKQTTTVTGADHALPAASAAAGVPMDTACRPDNKPSAYDTARSVVSQAWSQPYTPMFTLGRVALKIPDRHPSDLPPTAIWTRPYCEALEGEGIALMGAYVREGCIHIVLDVLDFGGADEGEVAPPDGERARSQPRASPPSRLLPGPASAPASDGNNRSTSRNAGGWHTNGSRTSAAGSNVNVGGTRRSNTANDFRPGAADAEHVLMGRTSDPGLLQPQAGVLGREPPQASRWRTRPQPQLQQQPQALRQHQQQRMTRRHAPARVWSASAAVATASLGNPAGIIGGSSSNNNVRRFVGRPVDEEGVFRGGGGGGGGARLSDGQDDGGSGSGARVHPRSPTTRRVRQPRRASVPSLSTLARPATHPAVHPEPPAGRFGQPGWIGGTGSGASHDTAGGAASAAASQRLIEVLPPETWVGLLGTAVGGGGQDVTVQMPGGADAWSVQAGAPPAARLVPPGGTAPDLMCISPPCVLAGPGGPLILYAVGTDLQGVASGGAVQGASAGPGGEGAAAMGGAEPLTVHVRYRGAYQPCRATLLGDQMPAEVLGMVLPLDASRRAEVLCLQLPRAPPLPGLMFVECQRGGLLGAALPVLVAPNSGVWQEVAALANDCEWNGGQQRAMAHRFVTDLGLFLDYLATAPLPPGSQPPQSQRQQPPTAQPGVRHELGALLQRSEPATISEAVAGAAANEDSANEDAAAIATCGSGRNAGGGEEAAGLEVSRARAAADAPAGVASGADDASDGLPAVGDGPGASGGTAPAGGSGAGARAGGFSRLQSLVRLLSNADRELREEEQRQQLLERQQREHWHLGQVQVQGRPHGVLHEQLCAVEDEGAANPHGAHGVGAAELLPSLPQQQHHHHYHHQLQQQRQQQQESRPEQELQRQGHAGGGQGPGPDPGIEAGGPWGWEQQLGVAYGSCPGPNTEDPIAGTAEAEAEVCGRTISVPEAPGVGSSSMCAAACAPLSRFAEMRNGAPIACGGARGEQEEEEEDEMLVLLPPGPTSLLGSSNLNWLSSDGLKRMAMIGAAPIGVSYLFSRPSAGGTSDAGVSGAAPLVSLNSYSGPMSMAAAPPPPHGQSFYNCRMEIPEPLSPAASAPPFEKEAVSPYASCPETPSQLLRLPPVIDEVGLPVGRLPQPPFEASNSGGSGGGGGPAAQLERSRRASCIAAGPGASAGGGTGTLLSITAFELAALPAALAAGPDLITEDASAVANLLHLPPLRKDSTGTELLSWDSSTDVAAATTQLPRSSSDLLTAASVLLGRLVGEFPKAQSPPQSSFFRCGYRTQLPTADMAAGADGGGGGSSGSCSGSGSFAVPNAGRSRLHGREAACTAMAGGRSGGPGRLAAGCSGRHASNSVPLIQRDLRRIAVSRSKSANLEAAEARLWAATEPAKVSPHREAQRVAADEGVPLFSAPGALPANRADALLPPCQDTPAASRPDAGPAAPATAVPDPAVAGHSAITQVGCPWQKQEEQQRQELPKAADGHSAATGAGTSGPMAASLLPAPLAAVGPPIDLLSVLAELESLADPPHPGETALRLPPPLLPPGSPDGGGAAAGNSEGAPAQAAIGAVELAGTAPCLLSAAELELGTQGSWPAARSGAAQLLAARVRYMGVGLLAFSMQRGWPHTTLELLAGLERLGMGLADVDAALAAREGGLGLLHLAVISHQPALLRALLQLGAGVGRRGMAAATVAGGPLEEVVGPAGHFVWDVGARGPGSLTPLHVATVLDDGGEMASLLLETLPEASCLWFTAGDDSGCTPAEMATQARREGLNQLAMAKLAEVEFGMLQQLQQPQSQPHHFAKHQPYRMHQPIEADLQGLHGFQQQWQPQRQPQQPGTPCVGSVASGTGGSAAVQAGAAAAATSEQPPLPPDTVQAHADAGNGDDGNGDVGRSLIDPGGTGGRGDAWRAWMRHAVALIRRSVRGWPDLQLEWQYRTFRASSLSVVDATCGIVFTALFLLPAIDLARRRDDTEIISHCIFNAGLLGPYALRLVVPRFFLRRRNTALMLGDACKALLVLLTLVGVLPFPKVWANFSRGNMDVVMLVFIKPLAEQVTFPVAVLQRIIGMLADTHIYSQVTYAGALVPAFVRSTLQNLAAVMLLLLLDIRARMSFEKSLRGPCIANASRGSGTSQGGVSRSGTSQGAVSRSTDALR